MTGTSDHELAQALAQLDECERLVTRLHKLCCEPDRSPRMQSILADIDVARRGIDAYAGPESAREVVQVLESIGAQLGHLQVTCCTMARMPLYAEGLGGLAATQIHIARSIGGGH